ncbi:MAG: hypothetical protein QOG10_6971 [Kribbellaceae bacterium]|nr:hypothetical protein [Kribbellaceae bacterium]
MARGCPTTCEPQPRLRNDWHERQHHPALPGHQRAAARSPRTVWRALRPRGTSPSPSTLQHRDRQGRKAGRPSCNPGRSLARLSATPITPWVLASPCDCATGSPCPWTTPPWQQGGSRQARDHCAHRRGGVGGRAGPCPAAVGLPSSISGQLRGLIGDA